MGTVKVTKTGDDKYDVEDADGEVHTGLSAEEVTEFVDIEAAELPATVAAGQGGVAYFDEVDDEDEEESAEDEPAKE